MAERILSADSHIVEPADYWLRHMDHKFKDRAPRAYEDDEGVVMFVVDGSTKVGSVGAPSQAGVRFDDPSKVVFAGKWEEVRPGCADPAPRMEDMLKLNDLRHCRLLHADIGQHRVGEEWSTWLGAAGLSFEPDRGVSFYDPSLAMQAAIEGLGIAIGYDTLVADDLASGRLVAPFDFKVRAVLSYYFVCPKKNAELAKIACFRDWISAEARSSCLSSGVESPS